MRPSTIEELLAHRDIEDLVKRRGRAADAKDPEQIVAQHVPGSRDSHGIFDGTIEDFAEHLRTHNYADDRYGLQRHTVSNIMTVLHGPDLAQVESMHVAYHRLRLATGHFDVYIGGRYLDVCRRTQGRWLIESRSVVYDWSRSSPAVLPAVHTHVDNLEETR